MMHMTFYWSRQVTLLFDSWKTTTWLGYALTLLACLIVPAFYQYLEDLRVRVRLASLPSTAEDPIQITLLQGKLGPGGRFSAVKLAGAAIFAVNSAIGYMLMLAVMSFNGGVFVAIVVGLAVGYLLFRSGEEEVSAVVDNPCACA
ncbi:copper transporter 5.1 [Argentina anserina]|uniref:copper transporter 5.1 n=1 Tax=Argentina anserina TaxID=57926 RepID=UPI002176921A|nr:copper transporter 5.1 [Potentilla anserina]